MANQPKSQFAQLEEEMIAVWGKEKTFEQSLKQREGRELFSFYDGPPFANGLPHFGHSLVTSIKDSMLRYKTMRGYYVPRRNGWDCHGLPVEYEIEKQLGVSGKKQILELGLAKFNTACRDSIFRYKDDWEAFLKRIGRWSEYDNYYATVDRNYTESVWWVMKQVHEKGLLYKSFKSVPYCSRCATPLSNFELNEGYRDNVADPSLYIKFKLAGEDRSLLAWTTTPWSLPGNAAVAVNPKETYVTVELKNDDAESERLVLAEKRLEVLDSEYAVVSKEPGSALVGKNYQPLFTLEPKLIEGSKNIYRVWPADFVSIEDGSGVLHVAPAYGEDDLSLGQQHGLPVLHNVGEDGNLRAGYGHDELAGTFFKAADKPLIEQLTRQGAVFAAQTSRHTYPFCWRCDSPLLYYAIDSWFVKVTGVKDQLKKTAAQINWVPEHIKQGRFGQWLEGARDWAISRNRYWGAPLPIWQNVDDPSDYLVVGSTAELAELGGKVPEDLHRPFIDEVTFTKDGKTYRRIEEVIDCWFESGSMSVAQLHYPFENQARFGQTFPADFIIEGLDQTRQWFYVQHVIATILFNRPAYKNVVVNGMIMAADGQKLSKRLKNYPPTGDVFDSEGADAWRLYLLSCTQASETAEYMRFEQAGMRDMQRNVLMRLWNTYKFFKMYAEIDSWQPPAKAVMPVKSHVLDRWILSRLSQTIATTTKNADEYKIAHAIQPILTLIDDLSNWYVRRSRRRFWKSEDDADKQQAYATLHYVLVRTCQLLAPWAPFLSDYIYRQLRGQGMPHSVHLTDWPEEGKVDQALLDDMQAVRDVITEGLARRAHVGIKVRQPLAKVVLTNALRKPEAFLNIIAEELNVKEVSIVRTGHQQEPVSLADIVELDTAITPTLRREGLMREVVRHVQAYRKESGLDVDNRIKLELETADSELTKAITEHAATIKDETLAKSLTSEITIGQSKLVKLEASELRIALRQV